jgi:ABC-type dipeptide/oligopeptide/nickel transport system ATPase component
MLCSCAGASPQILIADEPTAGLDVSIQDEVLDLMQSLARECGTAQLVVTADFRIAAKTRRTILAL